MKRTGLTGRLSRAAANRPWLFVIGWLVAFGVAGYLASGPTLVIDDSFELTVPTESGHAEAVIDEHFGDGSPPGEILIVESAATDFSSPAFQIRLADLEAELAAIDSVEWPRVDIEGTPETPRLPDLVDTHHGGV